MSNSVRFQITQKELDENNNVSDENDYTFAPTFTLFSKQDFTLVSGNQFQTISFGRVTTSSAIKITTDETITIQLNSGTESFTITSGVILIGSFTGLAIKNNSGNTATIQVQIYGS